MGLPLNCTISVIQNQDYGGTFGFATKSTVTPDDLSLSTPISFVGSTAKFSAYQGQSPTSPLLISLSSPTGIVLAGPTTATALGLAGIPGATLFGTIALTFTYGQTVLFPVGDWWYDIEVTTGSNTKAFFMQGVFHVGWSLTR